MIGKGGETIRTLIKETNTEINITENGTVVIAATSQEDADAACAKIKELTAEVEINGVYEGRVIKILDNNVGAIVEILPGQDGLVHISQIVHERVNNVNDHLKVGDVVTVKVLDRDDRGRIKLSIKALLPKP